MATMVYNISEHISLEYQIAASGSATTALALDYLSNFDTGNSIPYVNLIISAVGADITFIFGNSTVSASTSVNGSTKALPAGNFTIASGKTYSVRMNRATQNYVSVKTATGSGTAVIDITRPLQ